MLNSLAIQHLTPYISAKNFWVLTVAAVTIAPKKPYRLVPDGNSRIVFCPNETQNLRFLKPNLGIVYLNVNSRQEVIIATCRPTYIGHLISKDIVLKNHNLTNNKSFLTLLTSSEFTEILPAIVDNMVSNMRCEEGKTSPKKIALRYDYNEKKACRLLNRFLGCHAQDYLRFLRKEHEYIPKIKAG